jgi:nucleotide-binding universal stress UspA family protein
MRSILVHADRGQSTPSRLETGMALARAHGGHVTVLIDTPVARYIAMDPLGGSYVATDALNQAIAEDDAKAAAIEAQLTGQDVPFDVIRSEAEAVDALAAAARLADVVVTSRSSGIAGDLAMSTHTPVLVLPDDSDLRLPLERACVAWDGGDEAALALRSAVPLLASCGEVHVLTVKEKPGGFPATGAMDYLARHGVKAELVEILRTGSTADSLSAAVAQRRAQLLVMGAYGKSRMREYIFGGVTHHFLEEAPGPALLLAH